MLKQLLIRNIAIIETLDVSFQAGLTVITGESGSGKSILLDAIGLAFGAKASPRETLRSGATRGSVELIFDVAPLLQQAAFSAFLLKHEIELPTGETELLLTREFTASGSRSRINGTSVNRELLEALRPWMIDLHGQHELTSLFFREQQREYLDAFGGSALMALRQTVATAYDAWHGLKSEYNRRIRSQQETTQQKDFMAFQLAELTEAQLTTGDEDDLARQELNLLSHGEKLINAAAFASALLMDGEDDSPAIIDQVTKVEKKLSEVSAYDTHLDGLLQQMSGLEAELKSVASELLHYSGRVDLDPERLADLTDRLDVLEKLKRKHGPTLTDVITKRDSLALALDALETVEEDMAALERQLAEKERILAENAAQLTVARQTAADRLKGALLKELQALTMPGVLFDVSFEPIAYNRAGVDGIEFLFSANPGEPLRPLAKVASGGELSRFLLAMKVLTAEGDGLLTLVFDEIDSGISGPTAKAVAEKLGHLSRQVQVLTITHQPMIAAMGRQHLYVEKTVLQAKNGNDTVQVKAMALEHEPALRLQALSRLVSGMESQDEAVEKFIRRLQQEADAFYIKHPLKTLDPVLSN